MNKVIACLLPLVLILTATVNVLAQTHDFVDKPIKGFVVVAFDIATESFKAFENREVIPECASSFASSLSYSVTPVTDDSVCVAFAKCLEELQHSRDTLSVEQYGGARIAVVVFYPIQRDTLYIDEYGHMSYHNVVCDPNLSMLCIISEQLPTAISEPYLALCSLWARVYGKTRNK